MCELTQKELIRLNIAEAREQLQEIEESLKKDEEYSEVELQHDLEHAYHHLNYAWNIRKLSDDEVSTITEQNFASLSRYPKDDILEYE
jgi:hypothetical protein